MSALLPPATIGIIGGGQLGMMTVREAQRMGYRTVVWDPDPDCPASRLTDDTIFAPFNDRNAATILVENSDVVTYEFENVDSATVERVEETTTVFPGSGILKIAQHRKKEKEELQKRGFPVVRHAVAQIGNEISQAISGIELPVVVKTTTAGYDGKGQTVLRSQNEVDEFLKLHTNGSREFVAEQFLDLQCELSCIAVRTKAGEVVAYPVSENMHRNNILHRTIVPARVSDKLAKQALELGASIIESFEMVGVLCVEMFVTKDGALLVNELAPRPHNSGHYTLDATTCSQFEALVRAVCGLPVPTPKLLSPCAMVNVLGKHLERLDVSRLSRQPGVKLHLYGKKRVEPNRKMGHITVLGESGAEVDKLVKEVETMIGEA
ncbi:MAG: 5-(carboxyamino)imidazole ribonucleotide synthase [Ignavibacteriae bacterium]|nr:5-(carboxyamino)imidazole ribonucleotide synthase [Ignavibacteriota bacterium]